MGLHRSPLLPGIVLAIASFSLISVWAFSVRPLNAPDEPAHLQAIMQVRNQHVLPEIHYNFDRNPHGEVVGTPGDQSVRDYATGLGITNSYALIPYESMQPPLYYLAAGLLAETVPPDPQLILYMSRLLAALFGAGTVYFCWAATRELAPASPVWAIGAAGFVALLPEFCFNSATAANDSLANLACTLAFYFWIRGLRRTDYDPWLLKGGAIVGLALLAKSTAIALIPGLALLVVFRAWRSRAGEGDPAAVVRRAVGLGIGAAGGVILVCGWWLLRNLAVYGEPMGSQNSFEFYRRNLGQADLGDLTSISGFLVATWQRCWAVFGRQDDFGLGALFYEQAALLTIVLLLLSAVAISRTGRRNPEGVRSGASYGRQVALVMLVVVVTLAAGYLYFNVSVALQPQGRYFYAGLLPISLLLTGGLHKMTPNLAVKSASFGLLFTWLAVMNLAGLIVASGPLSVP